MKLLGALKHFLLLNTLFYFGCTQVPQKPDDVWNQYKCLMAGVNLNTVKPEICGLPPGKKANLCVQVLERLQAADKFNDLFINYRLMIHSDISCVIIALDNNQIIQPMLPCIGAHNPVRTSQEIDDYRHRIFIFNIPQTSIIFVFIQKRIGQTTYYKPLMYFSDNYKAVTGYTIPKYYNIQLTTDEVAYNNNLKQIQTIYIREKIMQISHEVPDLIAVLESTEFSNLCNKLLENVGIRSLGLARTTGYQKPEALTRNVILDALSYNLSKPYMMQEIVYPCYVMDIIEDRPKWDTYFISNGPRPSSVTLYKRLTEQQSRRVNSNNECFFLSPSLLAENVTREQLHNIYIVAF